jgi:Uma2 family endonuclease
MSSSRAVANIPYTYEDYCYLPNDGRRYELVDGELYMTPAPSPFHQTVSRRLQHALMTQLEDRGIGLVFNAPVDVILSDTTVVQPDLAIVKSARKHIISNRGIEGPPDVVVEILSPASQGSDLHLKRSAYARFGVPEYWIVDPKHGFVEVLVLSGDGYSVRARLDRASELSSATFPEIAIPLAPMFAPH